jgi:hypothetical protein
LGLSLPSYLANCKSNVPNKGFSLVGKPIVFVGQSARFFCISMLFIVVANTRSSTALSRHSAT